MSFTLDPTLQRIIRLAKTRDDLAALWLYGSRSRRDHHADSDYDLAAAFTGWIDDAMERRLRPEMLALEWQQVLGLGEHGLSVVDLAIAPIPLGWSILSQGQLLVDCHPQLRMHQESRIMSRWELDYLHQERRHA